MDFFKLHNERRGCNKGSFLVPAKPIHILCVISLRYCPFVIENLALTGLRFGTFGAIKVGWEQIPGKLSKLLNRA